MRQNVPKGGALLREADEEGSVSTGTGGTVARTHGYVATVIAFALNLLVVWVVPSWAPLG